MPPSCAAPGAPRDLREEQIQTLACTFAAEPELISACLEGPEARPPGWAHSVLAAAERAVGLHPEYADLHYHTSRAALALGRAECAAEHLEEALRVNPAYGDALILAARVALERGAPAVARARLDRALAGGANYPDVHLLRGAACSALRDWAGARVAYTQALALNAHLPHARQRLAALPATGRDEP